MYKGFLRDVGILFYFLLFVSPRLFLLILLFLIFSYMLQKSCEQGIDLSEGSRYNVKRNYETGIPVFYFYISFDKFLLFLHVRV